MASLGTPPLKETIICVSLYCRKGGAIGVISVAGCERFLGEGAAPAVEATAVTASNPTETIKAVGSRFRNSCGLATRTGVVAMPNSCRFGPSGGQGCSVL